MAIGFQILDASVVKPDKFLTKTARPKVLLAAFGDGYEQRLGDGINTLAETYALTFNNRLASEVDDIIALFESKAGVTAFDFTYPDSNGGGETTIKVVCDEWSQIYTNDIGYGCSATFRRVYE